MARLGEARLGDGSRGVGSGATRFGLGDCDAVPGVVDPIRDDGLGGGVLGLGGGEIAATNIALVLHELATNFAKHGALSSDAGLLDVACQIEDDTAVLIWTERGGPTVTAPATETGFGSKLLDRIVKGQFRGEVDYSWAPEGLIAILRIPTARLAL